jgi:hypothetical protein
MERLFALHCLLNMRDWPFNMQTVNIHASNLCQAWNSLAKHFEARILKDKGYGSSKTKGQEINQVKASLY